ncbi:hypothetical protein CP532_6604 [Ophiocordyceps camponoti-leonardi (nom. inval.)]|nr:hypothetical protein CP532_6604 [Ophiocordyceps camponoti-leonardi (nom. inval.)]
MREIVTLQLGNFSNYTATHFWNAQESYFTYDDGDDGQAPPPVDHNVHWRAGIGHDGRETFLPRTVIYDLKGAFGSLRKINALYDAVPQVDAAQSLSLWSGPSTVHKQPALNPGPYQQSLDAGLEPAQLTASAVRHWSDFSRVYFHPRSLVQLYDYELDSTIRPFDRFAMGHELFDSLAKEHDVLDRDWRPFVEECDAMQGIQVVATLDDAWGGFASFYLEALRDEYPKSSIWVWGLQNPQPFSSPGSRQMRLVNTAQSLIQTCSMASTVVPLAMPTEDRVPPHITVNRNSLWETSGLLSTVVETATLPSRLTDDPTTLSDMAEHLNIGGSKPLARASMIAGRQASDLVAKPMDLTPSYPSRKRARVGERDRIFGQLTTRRGGDMDRADLKDDALEQPARPMVGNPVTRLYTSSLPFPLLNSFPPLYEDASSDVGGIPVKTVLSTDSSISTRLRSLRSQIRPSVSAVDREEMGNALSDIVDAYQQGYSSDSDEGDDDIIDHGEHRPDRSGTGTCSIFAPRPLKFSLNQDARRVSRPGIGNGSREFLDSVGLSHREVSDFGPVGGFQVAAIIISAWNPKDLKIMALPPCHMFAQFYVSYPRGREAVVGEEKAKGRLHCQLYQRSCQLRAINIHARPPSCDLVPGSLTHVMGDAHVYLDHVEALEEQLKREPRPFPEL